MKKNKLDFTFTLSTISFPIIGMIYDYIMWKDVTTGGFPVYSTTSIYASYAVFIVLFIYNLFKKQETEYIKWPMFFLLPFLHIFVILAVGLICALIMNIIN